MLMEILMYCYCHVVTNAEHSPKSIGTHTQMSYLAQELKRVSFFLERISIITLTQHLYLTCLYLYLLARAHRLYQLTVDTQAGSCSYIL